LENGYRFEPVEGVKVHSKAESTQIEDLTKDGRRDVDENAMGAEPNWVGDNFGTPFPKGSVKVRVFKTT